MLVSLAAERLTVATFFVVTFVLGFDAEGPPPVDRRVNLSDDLLDFIVY